jgi:hypothetical protein
MDKWDEAKRAFDKLKLNQLPDEMKNVLRKKGSTMMRGVDLAERVKAQWSKSASAEPSSETPEK